MVKFVVECPQSKRCRIRTEYASRKQAHDDLVKHIHCYHKASWKAADAIVTSDPDCIFEVAGTDRVADIVPSADCAAHEEQRGPELEVANAPVEQCNLIAAELKEFHSVLEGTLAVTQQTDKIVRDGLEALRKMKERVSDIHRNLVE